MNWDNGMAVLFEEPDGFVGIAIELVAGAQDRDSLRVFGHDFPSIRFPMLMVASIEKPSVL